MFINWEDSTLRFDPISPDPLAAHGIPLPVYGNYGGPNWSAGQVGGTITGDPLIDPAPVDALDTLFFAHDFIYQTHPNPQTNPADLVARIGADIVLVESMHNLTFTDPGAPNYDPEAGLYEGLATLGIVGQLAAEGVLQNLPPADQLQIAAATQEAIVNFEAGLVAVPGEAKSLHGVFHVFEHQFLDLLHV
jgi:hypothetical protein